MASTSSSTPSTPVTLSSTLSLPKSCTSHTANKIENLVEYSYIPESAQISESSYPLLSPYQLYKRPSSFTRSICTLISTRRPHPKEYIQSSRLDQCSLQATPAEQYVTLEIPSELISNWKREGFTHLHLGGIRLILTLHGRKGLPVTARIAMLDTRFKQYQDAVIGTVLTTLHAGSVLLTFYPNFNLSLHDPNLPTTLKVQVQIQGAEQISSAKIATLHHQLVYRLQNHALDLPTPEHHSDTLMVLAESDQIPTIIQILRQIPRHELIKLMPLEWISNYEQFHNNTAPIQTSERFNSEGYLVYPAKHNGHFLRDASGSGMCDPNCPCWDDWEEDDDYATTRKKKPKKKKPPVPCHHCNPKPPSDPPPPPAPLPIYRKELKWIAKHCNSEIPSPLSNPTPIVQPLACMMFSSTSSDYSSSFPPLESHTDSQRNVVSKPFIPSPITSTGHLEPPKPFESVLNWQTQNARAQNDTLLHLNSKVEHISLRTEQIETKVDSITTQMQQIHQNLHSRIGQLDSELRAMLAHRNNVDHSSTTDNQSSDSNLAVSDSPTETDTESSASTSDSEKSYADITKILMAQPDPPTQGQPSHTEPYVDISSKVEEEMPESSATNQPSPPQPNPPSQKSSNGPWFTFDDLPSHKWRDRLNEMSAWIDLQMLRTRATTQSVLREFATRFTGALRDWFDSLGQYRQLQFVDLPEVSSALAVLHDQFLGDPSVVFEAARKPDYLNMKCCSLNAKDLDFHYKQMSLLFYKLNRFNEPTLKHVFLASLPEELQPDIQRQLTASNLSLDNISLGKIFQLAKTCLDKLCEQKQFFKELLKENEPFRSSHDDHRQLLTQFYDIIQSHGIMLSAKKSTIATDNIEFLAAVTALKQIAQNPPPLKLITDGKRILQTDASDESWGAILLEELNEKEHFIAYASGHFSETQKHYHSVFKEILAVKNGIKKFEYHMIGHHFLIRMDSSAFPNIFHFKVKHIKGSQNLIPDMLSRLSKPGPSTQPSKRPAQPSKVDKATQTSPKYTPKYTPRDYNCPYPPCRGPSFVKVFVSMLYLLSFCPSLDRWAWFSKKVCYRGISAGNPSLRTTGPKYSFNCCSSGITTPHTLKLVSELSKGEDCPALIS
ncbi:hypothetical protein KPL71_014576 [Citrus sinensis]|uniref:Uncharacterized protein n=1 Tax=Citrus sinensis TaxID=2711 RepID=A0ACB8KCN2_CITSI|nr:hypothetical protein KPL71_014576 [Citrus sinensis]